MPDICALVITATLNAGCGMSATADKVVDGRTLSLQSISAPSPSCKRPMPVYKCTRQDGSTYLYEDSK